MPRRRVPLVPVLFPSPCAPAAVQSTCDIENLDIPSNVTITSTAFGRITRTQPVDQAGPRTVQFQVRYTF